MDTKQYLESILKDQTLADDSQELKDLQTHRANVEIILRDGFPDCSPTIQYGGSKAKGTLIREYYDLDIVSYFPADDTTAGDTLKDIFQNVQKKLSEHYYVSPKTSALRLKSKTDLLDFHIDVVPGRYVDNSKGDCFIYQNGADKDRLKTNLTVHIKHVANSGVVSAIRLLKLWKTRRGLSIKQFVFELLIIDLLKTKKSSSLEDQLTHVWTSIKDAKSQINVEDPANPSGNDLSAIMAAAWSELATRSADTLKLIESSGWEAVFGTVEEKSAAAQRITILKQAAATVKSPSQPWLERNNE